MSIELVHVYRGNCVESIHRGDIVAINQSGDVIFQYGDHNKRTFWRSSAKPFQAIPMVESEGLEEFGFTTKELSLMTSSHGGEEEHVIVLKSILEKIKKDVTALDCGKSRPMYEGTYKKLLKSNLPYTPANNPCSGKHSCMLTLGIIKDIDLTNYIDPSHPIQKIMLKTISEVCELESNEIDIAIDGCGVPVFGLPIYNMAKAYSKLSNSSKHDKRTISLQRIASAMIDEPYYVAGTSRLDTILMEETKGKVLAKLGAESVYCMTIMDEGIGIAMKIEDGGYRALNQVVPDLLIKHKFITNAEYEGIKKRLNLLVKNHRNQVVGYMKSVF